jgi:hypothetical protein
LSTALSLLLIGAFCCAAGLTSIVFCAVSDFWLLLIADAIFCPDWIVHGIGVWFGG